MYKKDEAKLLHKEFWEAFNRYTIFYSQKIGHPIVWTLYKTEIKGIELKFEINTKMVSVILEVNSRDSEKRFDYYVELDRYRNIINLGFDENLKWKEEVTLPEGKIVSQISICREGVNFHNRDHWKTIFNFMAENMYQLQSNFTQILPMLKEHK